MFAVPGGKVLDIFNFKGVGGGGGGGKKKTKSKKLVGVECGSI